MSLGGGGQTTPLFKILKVLLKHTAQTCLYILGYIAYIFNRGVDASPVNNLLKKALSRAVRTRSLSSIMAVITC